MRYLFTDLLIVAMLGLMSCVKGKGYSDDTNSLDTVAVMPEISVVTDDINLEPFNIDSAAIKRLWPKFNVIKDEFDPDEVIWYIPKDAPKYVNQNGIYSYFMENKNGLGPLRLRVQYYAEDWLFIKKAQFSINGKAYEIIPYKTQTDLGDGMIWEWFDEPITIVSEEELINALASATDARMKLIGRNYYNIKTITSAQIESIKNSVELYKAMGGHL